MRRTQDDDIVREEPSLDLMIIPERMRRGRGWKGLGGGWMRRGESSLRLLLSLGGRALSLR
jgi:hypothetical protein